MFHKNWWLIDQYLNDRSHAFQKFPESQSKFECNYSQKHTITADPRKSRATPDLEKGGSFRNHSESNSLPFTAKFPIMCQCCTKAPWRNCSQHPSRHTRNASPGADWLAVLCLGRMAQQQQLTASKAVGCFEDVLLPGAGADVLKKWENSSPVTLGLRGKSL